MKSKVDFEGSLALCYQKADVHMKENHFDKVIECYEEVLSIAKPEVFESSNESAALFSKLGKVYAKMDRNDEALKCLRKEEKLREKKCDNPKKIAKVLIRKGTIQRDSGNFSDAFKAYEEGLANLILSLTKGSKEDIKHDIVGKLEQLEEGIWCQEKMTKSIGDDYVSPLYIADTVHDMGNLCLCKRSFIEAICCYETSLKVKAKMGCEVNVTVALTKYNMGLAYLQIMSNIEAIECFEEVLLRLQNEANGKHNKIVSRTKRIIKQIKRRIRKKRTIS